MHPVWAGDVLKVTTCLCRPEKGPLRAVDHWMRRA